MLLLPAALFTAPYARAQDLGHKLLGGVGIDAGVQAAPGLYLSDRLVRYDANRLRDRNGDLVPIRGLSVDVVANAFGASLTLKPKNAPYLSFAFGLPLADISVNASDPRIAVDRSGFADIFVQPLKLGWRFPRADIVTSYAFYAPTGRFEPRGREGVGRGFWSHQFSLGGAIFWSRERQIRASALLSYDINLRKRGIDIRRGNTLQVQGGAGVQVARIATIGIAGFALWQVTDDSGTDIPAPLRGARDRVYGLGPEVDLLIPALRARLEMRAEWDFGVRSRPQGRILVAGLTIALWQPAPPGPRSRTEAAPCRSPLQPWSSSRRRSWPRSLAVSCSAASFRRRARPRPSRPPMRSWKPSPPSTASWWPSSSPGRGTGWTRRGPR
ncbi:MAG TPA: transporter [Longimicrobiales bacterium]